MYKNFQLIKKPLKQMEYKKKEREKMKNAKEVEMALYKTVQIIQMSTKQEQRCRERERDSGLVRD